MLPIYTWNPTADASIKEQILAIPIRSGEAADFGEPYFVGQDEAGNEVYILGLNSQAPLCVRAILSLASQLGLADQIILVNTLTEIGLTTRIGGFISKKLRYPQLGKPLAAWGIIRSLPRLRRLVRVVKMEIVRKG